MSLLIKGMKMPAVGAYEFTLFCRPDGTASAKGFFTEFEGEPFEVIEVRTIPAPPPMIEVEPEPTMEEFMYGQDPGDPEDGRL